MVLNPNEINFGINGTEIRELKTLTGDDREIELRYLSKREITDIQKIETKALGEFEAVQTTNRLSRNESTSKGKINLEKQTDATYRKQKKAIALALSVGDVKIPESVIDNYPSNTFDEIWEIVAEMNHLEETSPEELEEELGRLSE